MPTITFDRFDGGLDLRQLASSADANRLRVLRNAYVTTGRTLRKRPGLKRVADLTAGTKGLYAGLNQLWTFSTTDITHTISDFGNKKLDDPTGSGLDGIEQVEVFNNYLYVCARYSNGVTKHHYLDGQVSTLVADANCPHTPTIAKKASKIFAIKDNVVRFSKTNDARNWSEANDAGFLPVNIQQTGASLPSAVGEYQSNLVVFFADSAQIWSVDPDPKLHRFVTATPVGTAYPFSHANMANDIFFLSPSGFRSISVQANSTNMMDMDVGSPIDTLMKEVMRTNVKPRALYFRGGGQLFCFIGNKAYTYTFSRAAKVSAWAVWTFPVNIDAVAELNGVLYLRSGNTVYSLDEQMLSDDGAPIEVEAELPFIDCRSPGVLKQFTGLDVAGIGSPQISYRYNPRDPTLMTQPITVSGDTRSLARLPVEICATNLAVRVSHANNEPFELAALSLYFNTLTEFAN